jgi:hypothetical protein
VRNELQEQMRGVLSSDVESDARNLKQPAVFRAYLTELRAAIDAKTHMRAQPVAPAADDPRMAATLQVMPHLASYEAAKENGTAALLPVDSIRIYNRIDYQRQLIDSSFREWHEASVALAALDEQSVDSPGTLELGEGVTAPDLTALSPTELSDYLRAVATLLKRTDLLADRYKLFDSLCQAARKGARTEEELIRSSLQILEASGWSGNWMVSP